MDKAKRQSNIELLRIMTMCGVIVLHYNNATDRKSTRLNSSH